jgi:hypothetical protein
VGLSLRASLAAPDGSQQPVALTAIDVASRFQTPGVDAHRCRRIVAGDPQQSAVIFRMASRLPMFQMPPLASKIVDRDALALLSRWVTELEGSAAVP